MQIFTITRPLLLIQALLSITIVCLLIQCSTIISLVSKIPKNVYLVAISGLVIAILNIISLYTLVSKNRNISPIRRIVLSHFLFLETNVYMLCLSIKAFNTNSINRYPDVGCIILSVIFFCIYTVLLWIIYSNRKVFRSSEEILANLASESELPQHSNLTSESKLPRRRMLLIMDGLNREGLEQNLQKAIHVTNWEIDSYSIHSAFNDMDYVNKTLSNVVTKSQNDAIIWAALTKERFVWEFYMNHFPQLLDTIQTCKDTKKIFLNVNDDFVRKTHYDCPEKYEKIFNLVTILTYSWDTGEIIKNDNYHKIISTIKK